MGSAVNGCACVIAQAGATPAPFGLVSWTDDLDALVSASAATMADPITQQNFADSNTVVQWAGMSLRRLFKLFCSVRPPFGAVLALFESAVHKCSGY